MNLLGENSVSFVLWRQPLFATTETKFQVARRLKGGWIQAKDLYLIIIFFLENIDKNTLESP